MIKTGCRTVGFCGQYVSISSYGAEADALLDLLCCDLTQGTITPVQAEYDVMSVGNGVPGLSLWLEGKCLFSGQCSYDLSYALINEVIYQCIVDNSAGHAIHAAAVGSEQGAVLLPGKSGSGKSTFTAWLLSRGCNYLTDELVMLALEERRLYPFTRPLSIKSGSSEVLATFFRCDRGDLISGESGFMLPHRLLNSSFKPHSPPLSLVLFPEYREGAATEFRELSPALGCARLMECYVNARNIKGHGISQLADCTRSTPIYQLVYGKFDGMWELLNRLFPALFPCSGS